MKVSPPLVNLLPPARVPGARAPTGMSRLALEAAATALLMTVDEVKKALEGGSTLAMLARGRGMSVEVVTTTVANALSVANPGLSPARAKQLAHRFMNNNSDFGLGLGGAESGRAARHLSAQSP